MIVLKVYENGKLCKIKISPDTINILENNKKKWQLLFLSLIFLPKREAIIKFKYFNLYLILCPILFKKNGKICDKTPRLRKLTQKKRYTI